MFDTESVIAILYQTTLMEVLGFNIVLYSELSREYKKIVNTLSG